MDRVGRTMENRLKGKVIKFKKRLEFARYCFPKGDDERFVSNVKTIGKVSELVTVEKGEGKEQGVLYHIYMEESHSGFFADHNRLLEYLYFADYYNLTPVVEYTDKYCYAEQHPVNGTDNPFEYYFMQPAGIKLDDLKSVGVSLHSRKENIMLAKQLDEKKEGYTKSEEYLKQMGYIASKYIKLRPEVEAYVRNEIEQLLQKGKKTTEKILGVHVRGTDFKQNYNGHPVAVTLQEYIKETAGLFQSGGYTKVFLATDDANAIRVFEKEFGTKVLYYRDVMRSAGNETVMKSESDRENHHYKLGLEVLRDMYTLAACDGLVAGLSQVSYAARIQKMSMDQRYKDLKILDKGINYHGTNNCPG